MDRIFVDLNFAQYHINDIIMYSNTMEDLERHCQLVFEQLKEHGLKLHLGKYRFFHHIIEYLDHTIYLGSLEEK